MFCLINKAFFAGVTILSSVNPLNATQLKRFEITNQKCKLRPKIFIVNRNEPVFYSFSIKTSKWSGS